MGIAAIPDKVAGKSSFFELEGVRIPITHANLRITRELVEMTDSADFDEEVGLIGPKHLPVRLSAEGTIEGFYRRSSTPSAIIGSLFDDIESVTCVFGLDSSTVVGSGEFSVAEYEQASPIGDIVKYRFTAQSYGMFRPASR